MKQLPMKRRQTARAFTLTELLVVVGLIAVMISLLLPVVGKARAAADAAACLSNLRQMGTAWHLYLTENRGRLPDYAWHMPGAPDLAWRAYWPGILEHYNVRENALLCPTAGEPIPFNQPLHKGYGNAGHAWTGKYQSNHTVARFSAKIYRDSSYGYNRNLTAYNPQYPSGTGGFGVDGKATRVHAVGPAPEVPLFFDSVFADTRPENGSAEQPVSSPPNLQWDNIGPAPEHWKFLIARHGRAIQVCMVDGSARRVPLEETYLLAWSQDWEKYRLSSLPMN
jgi:type II secretory pathway pseudopilin PulG